MSISLWFLFGPYKCAQVWADGSDKIKVPISLYADFRSGLFRIYMYDGACPEKGAICSYSGHVVGSFYIKVKFSYRAFYTCYSSYLSSPCDVMVITHAHTLTQPGVSCIAGGV